MTQEVLRADDLAVSDGDDLADLLAELKTGSPAAHLEPTEHQNRLTEVANLLRPSREPPPCLAAILVPGPTSTLMAQIGGFPALHRPLNGGIPRALRVKFGQEGVEIVGIPGFQCPLHRLDVLLRHRPASIRPPLAAGNLRRGVGSEFLMTATGEQHLRDGDEAIAAADWERARTCFEQARDLDGAPEALEGLSEVANFEGEYERAIELKEAAFAGYRERDQRVEASHVARWLAFMHATSHGNYAVASGWMGRAESVLEGVDECAAHGWLILDRAPFSRSPDERQQVAASALAIGQRFGDADLEVEAMALLGESHVALGRIDEGMKLLDQAMAALAGGEVADHKAIGEIYCRLLSACELATDVRRAEDWISAIDRHVVWTDFVRPTCRTHYGGILMALGRWQEAEAELLAAVETFEEGYRGDRAFPLVRMAELRVRQGRYEEAERLLKDTEWHPLARRAAAAIAFGRRELRLAEDLTRLCLEEAADNDPACGPALELLVAVQLARDDEEGARSTLSRLTALATGCGSPSLEASAELAAGRVAIVRGDDEAVGHLKLAVEQFGGLELPLETARARLELARALASNRPDAAAYEARLALDAFERLGAAHDCDAASGLLRTLGTTGRAWPKGHGQLTKRETEVLALLVEGLANAEIAERLFISVRTAEHHVASILAKLDLRSRAEAAAYGVRQGTGKDQ